MFSSFSGWSVTLTKMSNKNKMTVALFSPKGQRIRSRHILKNYCSDHHLDIQDFGDIKFFYNSEFLPEPVKNKRSAMALALEALKAKKKATACKVSEPQEIPLDNPLDSQMMNYSDLDSDLHFSPNEINGIPIHDTWTYYGALDHPILGKNGQFFWPRSTVEQVGYFRLKNLKLKEVLNLDGEKEMRPIDPDPLGLTNPNRGKTDGNMVVTNKILGNAPIMSTRIGDKLEICTGYKLGSSLTTPMIQLLPKLPSNALTNLTPSCPNQGTSVEKKQTLYDISISCFGACTIYGDVNLRLENPTYEKQHKIIVGPKGFSQIPFHLADYDLFSMIYDIVLRKLLFPLSFSTICQFFSFLIQQVFFFKKN